MMLDHLRRMARYNRWANARLFTAVEGLGSEAYHQARPAFFGSIHGTLNHILIGDRLWLARIEGLPAPDVRLDDHPYADLASLAQARQGEDERMIRLTDGYNDESGLDRVLNYRALTMPGAQTTPLYLCWLHLFNHQTHHRGQVHDQLTQTDIPPPSLDMMPFIKEQE
jgi:uncharacterized damage-inducible protein DinB